MSELPKKHHYIPIFLTKYWAGADGRVQRYVKYREVVERRVHPARVGWHDRLYELPLAAAEHKQALETHFFRQLDNMAAIALKKMNATPSERLQRQDIEAWTAFMMSLLHRTPECLEDALAAGQRYWLKELQEEVREKYPAIRGHNDPITFDEYLERHEPMETNQIVMRYLPNFITRSQICRVVGNLPWMQILIPDDAPSLLLSDNPLARTNGILVSRGHLAMPISPRRLLVVASDEKTIGVFQKTPVKQIAKAMNRWVVESAQHFVVAVDRSQEAFIKKHFGTSPKPSLHAGLGQD